MKKRNVKAAYYAYCEASLMIFTAYGTSFLRRSRLPALTARFRRWDFRTDREAIWFNVHSGTEVSLEILVHDWGSLNTEIDGLGYVLENWLPKKDDPNPIIARSLALSEEDVLRVIVSHIRVYIERCSTADEFEKSFRNQGGSMEDGFYWAEKGQIRASLQDGREFRFGAKNVFVFAHQEERQATLF